MTTGAVALVATVVGLIVDRATARPTGGPVEPQASDELFGGLAGRFEGLQRTWLQPGYTGERVELLFLVVFGTLLAAAVLARRLGSDQTVDADHRARLVEGLMMAALVVAVVRFGLSRTALIPGLLIAFPALAMGLVQLDRDRVIRRRTLAVLLPFALFCGAVLATQYRRGGGGEWGGRYFAVGLPVGIAVATVGLLAALDRFPAPRRRRLVVLGAATMALIMVMGLFGIRAVRVTTEAQNLAIDRALAPAGSSSIGDEPIVVSTVAGAGRWAWADLDRARWLRITPDELRAAAERLDRLGVHRFVLVSYDPEQDIAVLGSDWEADPEHRSTVETVTRLRSIER